MGHYAQIVDNRVVNVIVAEEEVIKTLPGQWVQTSYNTRNGKYIRPPGQIEMKEPLRYTYASVGMYYDPVKDIFTHTNPNPTSNEQNSNATE